MIGIDHLMKPQNQPHHLKTVFHVQVHQPSLWFLLCGHGLKIRAIGFCGYSITYMKDSCCSGGFNLYN